MFHCAPSSNGYCDELTLICQESTTTYYWSGLRLTGKMYTNFSLHVTLQQNALFGTVCIFILRC